MTSLADDQSRRVAMTTKGKEHEMGLGYLESDDPADMDHGRTKEEVEHVVHAAGDLIRELTKWAEENNVPVVWARQRASFTLEELAYNRAAYDEPAAATDA